MYSWFQSNVLFGQIIFQISKLFAWKIRFFLSFSLPISISSECHYIKSELRIYQVHESLRHSRNIKSRGKNYRTFFFLFSKPYIFRYMEGAYKPYWWRVWHPKLFWILEQGQNLSVYFAFCEFWAFSFATLLAAFLYSRRYSLILIFTSVHPTQASPSWQADCTKTLRGHASARYLQLPFSPSMNEKKEKT